MPTLLTLQDLSDAWNKLRNAALGRGVEPLVSAELADEVGRAYEDFRGWLAEQGPLASMVETPEARAWLERHNELRDRIAQEAPAPERLAPELSEQLAQAVEQIERSDIPRTVLFVAVVAAGAALVLSLRRGRG